MKKSIQHIALSIVCLSLLSSCFSTYQSDIFAKTSGEKIPIENLECSTTTPEDVDVFYEGDSLNFSYRKIGFVTAYGKKGTPDSLIMYRLKYNSYLLCGNGIMDLIKTETIKEGAFYTQFSANSIRIIKDSSYYAQYPPQNDFSFYNFSKNDISYTTESTEFEPILTLLAMGAIITGFAIKVMNPSSESDNEEEYEYDYDEWEEDPDYQ